MHWLTIAQPAQLCMAQQKIRGVLVLATQHYGLNPTNRCESNQLFKNTSQKHLVEMHYLAFEK